MKSWLSVLFLVLGTAQASADTLVIETDENALFVRCTDMFGTAQCEMLFESTDEYYDCIAFDASDKPIATGVGNGGSVLFPALEHSIVADVKCR